MRRHILTMCQHIARAFVHLRICAFAHLCICAYLSCGCAMHPNGAHRVHPKTLSRSESVGQHCRHPRGGVLKAPRLPRCPAPRMRCHEHNPLEARQEGAEGARQGGRPHDGAEGAVQRHIQKGSKR